MNGPLISLPWPATVRAPASSLPFGPDAEIDHPGTDRLLFEAAMLELAEHIDICDACGDRTGPLCFLGGLKLDAVLELGDLIKDRRRGW